MDLNKAMLIGNVTRDPEARTTPGGQTVTSFSIATNRKWKDQATGEMKEDSQFHNIVAWGKLGEICSQYLKRGTKIFIEGRLQTRNWDDQQTGKKQYKTEIVAENLIMLDRKGDGGQGGGYAPATPSRPASHAAPRNNEINVPSPDQIPTIDIDDSQEEIKIEDIPF